MMIKLCGLQLLHYIDYVAIVVCVVIYIFLNITTGSNYTCENSIEILVDMLCDGADDCGDSSDENNSLCLGKLLDT